MSCTLLVAKSSWMLSLTLTINIQEARNIFQDEVMWPIKDRLLENQCVNSLRNLHFNQKLDPSLIIMQTIFVLDFYLTNTHQLEMFKNMSSPALRRVAGRRGQQPWKGSETPSLEALPWEGFPAPPPWRCPTGQPQACTLASGSGYRMVLPSLVWR